MNPLTILSGFSLTTKALLIGAVFSAGVFSGWRVENWRQNANDKTDIVNQIETGTQIQKESAPIIKEKAQKEKEIVYVYRTIREKINAVPDSNNICFSNDSLKLWNDAIAGANSVRPESSGATAGDDASSASKEEEPVVVNVGEILTNAAENFQTCNSNIVKHKSLISKVESLEGKMCVCSQ